jgi:hypothetical protein
MVSFGSCTEANYETAAVSAPQSHQRYGSAFATRLKPLTDTAKITDLALSYRSGENTPIVDIILNEPNAAIWRVLQLEHVTRLTLRGLCIIPSKLQAALAPPMGLKRVTLADCIIKRQVPTTTGQPRWLLVLQTLRMISQLTYGELSRLQVATEVDETPWYPLYEFANPRMALEAIWTTKEEVQEGLRHASITDQVTTSDFLVPTSPTGIKRRYLNLRWANFGADKARYGWTTFEVHVLRWHRAGLATGSKTIMDINRLYAVPKATVLRNPKTDAVEKRTRGAKRPAFIAPLRCHSRITGLRHQTRSQDETALHFRVSPGWSASYAFEDYYCLAMAEPARHHIPLRRERMLQAHCNLVW